jgi:hypothetical protein
LSLPMPLTLGGPTIMDPAGMLKQYSTSGGIARWSSAVNTVAKRDHISVQQAGTNLANFLTWTATPGGQQWAATYQSRTNAALGNNSQWQAQVNAYAAGHNVDLATAARAVPGGPAVVPVAFMATSAAPTSPAAAPAKTPPPAAKTPPPAKTPPKPFIVSGRLTSLSPVPHPQAPANTTPTRSSSTTQPVPFTGPALGLLNNPLGPVVSPATAAPAPIISKSPYAAIFNTPTTGGLPFNPLDPPKTK